MMNGNVNLSHKREFGTRVVFSSSSFSFFARNKGREKRASVSWLEGTTTPFCITPIVDPYHFLVCPFCWVFHAVPNVGNSVKGSVSSDILFVLYAETRQDHGFSKY